MSHAPFRGLAALLLASVVGCGSEVVPEAGPDAASACAPCGTSCCKADETCNAATSTCEAACVPQCEGKQCGDDGCGKTCGTCTDPLLCSPQGQCVSCLPACDGKECGDDGCGGECGTCTSPQTCDPSFLCTCTRKCSGKECGSDGCGGRCGTCDPGETCTSGKCVACTPDCTGKSCGPDGCGGTCAPGCQASQTCNPSGQCVGCTPNCTGKTCGFDGCGGTCAPGCQAPQTCNPSGQCIGCVPSCTGKTCGPDGCGGTCAPGCQAPQTCNTSGQCIGCVPNCTGKTCGPDGCGGNCAPGCQAPQTCGATGQCVCTPSCTGRTCGPDGCGGNCAPGCTAPATCSVAGTCVVPLPAAPTNLNAAAQTFSLIMLGWTDASTTETGFKIERATSASGPFAQVGTTGANVATYSAAGLAANTTYFFRVRATNSGGDSGYSNTASAKTPDTVPATPTGLTATPTSASAIRVDWTDASTNETGFKVERATASAGPFAQVAVTAANQTSYTNYDLPPSTTFYFRVKATNALGDSPGSNVASAKTNTPTCTATLSAPATNTTGSYAVTWTVAGSLCSTNRRLQEASSPAFSNPTTYSPSGNSWTFTGKATGTYCYRVDPGGGAWSNTACVAVSRTTTGTLRIQNGTHYWMIRARINGVERLSYPTVLDVNHYEDYLLTPGSVPYVLEVGTYDTSNQPQPWFNLQGTANVVAGQITTVTFANPTIGDLLSNFSTYRDWSGYYFDANSIMRSARYRFSRNGSFAFFDNGVQTATGTVTLTSWPDYSPIVSFKVCPTCATINLGYPFASFQYRNGPASWPTIEYTAQ